MANITRWNPVREMITLREAMDQLFNEPFTRTGDLRRAWHQPIDAYANDDAIVLVTDVPGLKPEEIGITLEGSTLTIRGEYKQPENHNYLIRERMTGKFERTLTVNAPIDTNKVEAVFENGTLTLTLPKAEASKPKQITVKPTVHSNN